MLLNQGKFLIGASEITLMRQITSRADSGAVIMDSKTQLLRSHLYNLASESKFAWKNLGVL